MNEHLAHLLVFSAASIEEDVLRVNKLKSFSDDLRVSKLVLVWRNDYY